VNYKIPKQCSQCGKWFKELFVVRDRLHCKECGNRQIAQWNTLVIDKSNITPSDV
jgi:DNA-directed RNA polymerase subunit RPC12/RpoP